MSRLIVKNLPAYLSDARLREHFSQKGLVTDVKLMTRPDGTSRRFGFVGYRSEQEAREALDYFHRTFIDTSRIQVDLAKKIGDDGLEEAKRGHKRSADDQHLASGVRNSGSEKATGPKSASKADVQQRPSKAKPASSAKGVSFDEFLAVMAPKKKRKTWQNEEDDPESQLRVSQDETQTLKTSEQKKARKEKKAAAAQKALAQETAPSQTDERDDRPSTPDADVNDEGLTDLDYMHKRMKRMAPIPEQTPDQTKEFDQSDSEGSEAEDSDAESEVESEDEATKAQQERKRILLEEKARKDQEAVDTIMSSGRLFVRNLPFAANEAEIEAHFSGHGPVKQTHITLDRHTKASKGMAYVTFEDPAHALAAFRAADGSTFQGRLLHVLPAVDLRPKTDSTATLKQARAQDRKTQATSDFNWGSLYMSADAVATSVADRLGINKTDILNPSDDGQGDSAAVRLALAETKVIRETKEFLEREGINVDAFGDAGRSKARSDTTILVKNIPYGTSPDTVRELFEKHGEVDRVLIPPAGTIALVDMVVPGEARVAFKALAYKRLENSVLYLEKAPEGTIAKRAAKDDISAVKSVTVAPTQGVGSEADVEAGATLFVKNLSFATTDAKLAELFGTLADFAFARVQTRVDSRDPSKRLSMGYGFVGYRSVSAAKTALNALNGKDLDGHSLALSFARRGQDADDTAASGAVKQKASSTKLIVKNLPFETTKKDVRALFAAHGQLKSVRVPRKAASVAGAAGGGARGFAFVEFTSKREAEAAFESLRHAHYLGRHLVLQWDSEDAQGLEGIRAKVKESFDSAAAQHRNAGGSRARKEKLKLGQEDIAEASRKERAGRHDVDD